MQKLKIECEDFDFSLLEGAFEGEFSSDCTLSLEITFVDEVEIRRLNNKARGVDAITDVLSFPSLDGILNKKIKKSDFRYDLDEDGSLFIGSIAICPTRAKEQAEDYGHSERRELFYLATHGICHLLGYDHMTDKDKSVMREKEERVLSKINITRF